jgi:hypothetical protein
MADLLQRIQRLQFSDRADAERLLLEFVNATFPELEAVACQLRPQAVSLNSFNGFLTLASGERKFFKTHTEEDNVLDEYYNARMLADAGYPVIQPTHSSTRAGQHLLIYEVIDAPSVFDLAWEIETTGGGFDALAAAQQAADDDLLGFYRATLHPEDDTTQAPVHQLFHHRLTRGRLDRFYGPGQEIALPGGTVPLAEVRRWRWSINGQVYEATLDAMITGAVDLLDPAQPGPSVIGHGDAHNGNVFFTGDHLTYFDPAFAGRHHPLLDVTKPLFHNVFAMWMYFPQEKRPQIQFQHEGDRVEVGFAYPLPPVREMFLRSKVQRVLIPTLHDLARRGLLRPDWRAYLKAALFCCPLLTLNLADSGRFSPEVGLLGLAMAVEMGAESSGERSLIDRTLDEVESAL